MIPPFILHFQEAVSSVAAATMATQSITAVRAEVVDADDSAFLDQRILAGTQTITEVRAEGADQDPRVRGFRTIPVECS